MKTTIVICGASIILLAAAFQSRAAIIAGPVTNPANGHDYYLLTPSSWSAAEAEAEDLGGTLSVVKNAAEQEWIFSKFGSNGGTNYSLWIGLRRSWPGGPFASVTDTKTDYFNWASGEPSNTGGNENFCQILTTGKWNDNTDTANPVSGVVEVPGKSQEKSLTAKEKSLIGTWYNNGDPDQTCWIAGTDRLLFAIDQNKSSSRAVYTSEGLLFFSGWKQHAEITGDKILWSRGNWWSIHTLAAGRFYRLQRPQIAHGWRRSKMRQRP